MLQSSHKALQLNRLVLLIGPLSCV